MVFGIRGKVALLVMVATAASALIVAKALTSRSAEVLREHELVDLGDETALRGWELNDQMEGLRDDLINVAFSPTFLEDVTAGKTDEELRAMARGLCRRNWDDHLRVDLVTFVNGGRESRIITEKAEFEGDDIWFPGPDERAGSKLHLSRIQRHRVVRLNLPGQDRVTRYEPVVWAVAPLDPFGESNGGNPTYIRIGMSLYSSPSPRHLFVLETEEGAQLVRHDEYDSLERGNDSVFLGLRDNPKLIEAMERRQGGESEEVADESIVKVDRLARITNIPLASPYFFQEGLPNEELVAAIEAKDEDEYDEFLETLQVEVAPLGRIGGATGGVREVRLLSRSEEDLAQLRQIADTAFAREFPSAFQKIEWRNVVECDEIHAWSVLLTVGRGEDPYRYVIDYAVFDDELASSIEYEMLSVQRVALLVAAGFGIVGFLIAMHFIRPLRDMTETAQTITRAGQEHLYEHISALADRLESKRRDEIGDISRASRVLFQELLTFQGKLEQRVSDRTHELRRANTELEKANDKLMSLSHEKDAFVAKVSHDLRQPLNAIFLQIEALRLSELDEEQKQDVDRIHAHAARELKLVNDILEYQKIIMGAETLSKDEIDISKLVSDLAEIYESSLEDKPVTFENACAENLGLLVADERRVRQILGNLIGNACKFTKEGTVRLEARPREIAEGDWVEFTITDTGRGMSPAEQAKAFVPFVSNKKDNAGGTGLGLSICKELVGQLGGKIGFVSELGKGTHFSVFFPLEPVAEAYDPERPNSALAVPIPEPIDLPVLPRDATVLVIDDDITVRNLLRRMLEAEGYQVLEAEDGVRGLEMAVEHQPDAITLDVVMPGGKDGWQVLRELKDSDVTQSIPVVMVSVMAEQEHGVALDVEDYLVKPIDTDRLSRVIHRVTERSPQRNLLLVDDDPDALAALSRVLEDAGWHAVSANDGAEALAMLEKTRPAAIILDLVMPEMDGFEFLEALERDEHLASIPVIVVSGKDPSDEERDFLRERTTAVLEKGRHTAGDLVAFVNARLRTRRGVA